VNWLFRAQLGKYLLDAYSFYAKIADALPCKWQIWLQSLGALPKIAELRGRVMKK
jgi:hypothetical protein